MNRELWTLAVQGLKAKKRSTLLLFLVLLLTLTLAVVTLSVTGSIRQTNETYRLDTYGGWHIGIPAGQAADEDYLREAQWLDHLGVARSVGTIATTTGKRTVGLADEGYLALSRVRLQEGRMPEKPGEIALEATVLSELGYAQTLGQEIRLRVAFDCTPAGVTTVTVEGRFTLCGVVEDYSQLWILTLNRFNKTPLSGFLVEEDVESLREEASVLVREKREQAQATLDAADTGGMSTEALVALEPLAKLALAESGYQYYFTVQEGQELRAEGETRNYLFNARFGTAYDKSPCVNDAAKATQENSEVNLFYTALVFAVTLLAVLCIYAVQLQKQVRQIALFRSIGITRRQLCVMLFYETVAVCVPALLLGVGTGALGTWAALRLALYSGGVRIQVAVPWNLLIPALFLWVMGVFLVRLAVFQIALREPLTGRMRMESRKALRYRRFQKAAVALLSVLLCADLFFTAGAASTPLRELDEWRQTTSYYVQPQNILEMPYLMDKDGNVTMLEFEMSELLRQYDPFGAKKVQYEKSIAGVEDGVMAGRLYSLTDATVDRLRQIPGVARVEAYAHLSVELTGAGLEDSEMYAAACAADQTENTGIQKRGGARPNFRTGREVDLFCWPEEQLRSYLDLDGVDMEAFRRGETVLALFPVDEAGQYVLSDFTLTVEPPSEDGTEKEKVRLDPVRRTFADPGLEAGDDVTLGIYANNDGRTTIRVIQLGTVTAKVAKVFQIPEDWAPQARDKEGSTDDAQPYTLVCSTAFLNKTLQSLPMSYYVGSSAASEIMAAGIEPTTHDIRGNRETFMTGDFSHYGQWGYSIARVYIDLNARYLGTDAAVSQACSEAGLLVYSVMDEQTAQGQRILQQLLTVLLAGACIALVLLLIQGNILALEAQREQRHYGILQALGMSRRELRKKLMGGALFRAAASAALGWSAYGGWVGFQALKAHWEIEQNQGGMFQALLDLGLQAIHSEATGEIVWLLDGRRVDPEQFLSFQSVYARQPLALEPWVMVLLTIFTVVLLFAVALLTKRRLLREDLMGKLRDEQ